MHMTTMKRRLAHAILACGVAMGTVLGSLFAAPKPAEAIPDLTISLSRDFGGLPVSTNQQFQVRLRVSNPGGGPSAPSMSPAESASRWRSTARGSCAMPP